MFSLSCCYSTTHEHLTCKLGDLHQRARRGCQEQVGCDDSNVQWSCCDDLSPQHVITCDDSNMQWCCDELLQQHVITGCDNSVIQCAICMQLLFPRRSQNWVVFAKSIRKPFLGPYGLFIECKMCKKIGSLHLQWLQRCERENGAEIVATLHNFFFQFAFTISTFQVVSNLGTSSVKPSAASLSSWSEPPAPVILEIYILPKKSFTTPSLCI